MSVETLVEGHYDETNGLLIVVYAVLEMLVMSWNAANCDGFEVIKLFWRVGATQSCEGACEAFQGGLG